jgi:hypothetical protein
MAAITAMDASPITRRAAGRRSGRRWRWPVRGEIRIHVSLLFMQRYVAIAAAATQG